MSNASAKIGAGLLALLLPALASPAAAAAAPPLGIWTSWDATFAYHGLTTRYSCDGLRSRMRDALLALGARADDLAIGTSRCGTDDTAAAAFPRLKIHATSLMPATEPAPGAVVAAWKPVTLSGFAGRDEIPCELYEQMLHTVLPKLATRARRGDLRCIPGQASGARETLTLEVLAPPP